MRRPALVGLGLALAGMSAFAEPRLTEPAIRAFLERQESAWNRGDVRAWAATHRPDATFVDQARNNQNGVTLNGASDLAAATAQARAFFARAKIHETSTIVRIEIAPDGQTARVFEREVSKIEAKDRPPRTICGESLETVVLAKGRILSKGQVDTAVRCPP